MPVWSGWLDKEWDSLFDVDLIITWHTHMYNPQRSHSWLIMNYLNSNVTFFWGGGIPQPRCKILCKKSKEFLNLHIYWCFNSIRVCLTGWLHVRLAHAHSSSVMQSSCFHLMNKLMRKVTSSYSPSDIWKKNIVKLILLGWSFRETSQNTSSMFIIQTQIKIDHILRFISTSSLWEFRGRMFRQFLGMTVLLTFEGLPGLIN